MRTSLYCLAIALAFRLALSAQDASLSEKTHALFTPGKIAIEWHFYDEHRVWLSINTFDHPSWPKDGFHPSFTYILTTAKPVVKKLPDGQYQISFTSDLTETLP